MAPYGMISRALPHYRVPNPSGLSWSERFYCSGLLKSLSPIGHSHFDLTALNTNTWRLQINVNGFSINIPAGKSSSIAAINTGISFIGGPSSFIKEFYALIPNSKPLSYPTLQGFYTFPCKTQLDISIKFAGETKAWKIPTEDTNLGQDDVDSDCVGAFSI
ncbi:hypothetical protein DL96DRAFT_1576792 [Flagelloscypha sp. PMI_526]|nr:hypothetical protein DL96DRAFT_1576792 [Flagelloscypha sp. PMI_526]